MRVSMSLGLFVVAATACAKSPDPTGGGDAGFVGRDDETDAGVTDPIGNPDPGPVDAAVDTSSGSCTGKIVINELLPEGSAPNDEFIELYNPSTCDVTIDGFKLLYKSAAGMPSNGAPLHTFAAGTVIKGKGYYVVGTTAFTGTKDATFNGGGVTVNGGMSRDGQIALFDTSTKKMDSVGYGGVTGDYIEASPAPKAAATASIGRVVDGVDTDDNSKDFNWMTTPTPGKMNGI